MSLRERSSYKSYFLKPRRWFSIIRHPKEAKRALSGLIRWPKPRKPHRDLAMDFLRLAAERYSVRSYRTDEVETEKLKKVLEAARLAPTADNMQPFRLIVMHTRGRESELRRIYDRDWFVRAPVVICACGIPDQAWVRSDGKNYCDIDAAIVLDHLVLAATSLGLGTCWISAFDMKAAQEVLGLPDNVCPIAFTPLGYPGDQPGPKRRKPLTEIVSYGRWDG